MVTAYVLLTVGVGKERDVFEKIKSIKEVMGADELYGEWDILVKINVEKFEELDKIVSDNIRSIDGIKLTSTMLVAEYLR